MKRMKALIAVDMGVSYTATSQDADTSYTISLNPTRKPMILKEGLEQMKEAHPDIYDEYVTISESRKLYIKKTALNAA